jgi:hypothetical protein
MNNNLTSLQELSSAVEKMYGEHNAQMKTLSKMITALARISGIDPKKFLEEVNSDENLYFANKYNQILNEKIREELSVYN